jgi:hypothetical protein
MWWTRRPFTPIRTGAYRSTKQGRKPVMRLLPPFSIRRARAGALAVAALTTLAGIPTAGVAQPLPTADIVPDGPARPPVPPDDPAVQARLPGCAVWTDRCVTCERAAGRISCSNIGIACQPQAVECVRAEAAEQKKEN